MECTCGKLCKNCKRVDNTVNLLKAVSEPNRLKVLCLLLEGNRSAGDIALSMDIPHNLVSFHLKILLDAGFLVRSRDGNRLIYSLREGKEENVRAFLNLSK